MSRSLSKFPNLNVAGFAMIFGSLLQSPNSLAAGPKAPLPPVGPKESVPGNYFTQVDTEGFTVQGASRFGLKPSCLKSNGLDLLILDPGHDDSSASTRSDAKVRGGNGKYVILWPEVHEGQLNFVTGYLVYSLLLSNPSLTPQERLELQSMIRFTRLPGETKFGQFESEDGYGPIGGSITSGVENRPERINAMMLYHRPFDPQLGSYSKTERVDSRQKSLLVSIHANSSEYYDEGDHIWIIPPKSQSRPTDVSRYLASFRDGFSEKMGNFFEAKSQDSDQEASLKRGARLSALRENILISKHSKDLAVLSTRVSTPFKFLTEGFVMNGKVGHLAYLEMKNRGPKKLHFSRKGSPLRSYSVTDVYLTYARSIVESLQKQLACEF